MLFSLSGNTEFSRHMWAHEQSWRKRVHIHETHELCFSSNICLPLWNNTLQSGFENKVQCACHLTSVEAVAGEQTGGRVDACHGVSDVRGRWPTRSTSWKERQRDHDSGLKALGSEVRSYFSVEFRQQIWIELDIRIRCFSCFQLQTSWISDDSALIFNEPHIKRNRWLVCWELLKPIKQPPTNTDVCSVCRGCRCLF